MYAIAYPAHCNTNCADDGIHAYRKPWNYPTEVVHLFAAGLYEPISDQGPHQYQQEAGCYSDIQLAARHGISEKREEKLPCRDRIDKYIGDRWREPVIRFLVIKIIYR
jgi:hypothetical protein